MASDYLSLGCTPADEPCIQVGHSDYARLTRHECRVYLQQLLSEFLVAHNSRPPVCRLTIKSFPHDSGSYHEVCAVYDDSNPQAIADAFWFDGNYPVEWSKESRETLASQSDYFSSISYSS